MSQTIGKKKLINDLSASTLQTIIIQVFSLAIFYITSKYLSKEELGEYNWSVALVSTFISLASFGLDIVLVKRIALGKNPLQLTGIHFMHTIMVSITIILTTVIINQLIPSFNQSHPLFLLVVINLCLINIAGSFRLSLTGLEHYKYLAILAIIVNLIKFVMILWLYYYNLFTILNVIYVFVFSSATELLIAYLLVNLSFKEIVKPVLEMGEYKNFIKEALPQLGVVFFDSALARLDWILLGIISTSAITAEYSFTYRMYESSKLPLIIITPVLLTRFSKLFALPHEIDDRSRTEITAFFKLELFLVMLTPIVLICTWTPLIDYLTNNKYGSVNEITFSILAICVPLHAIMNYLWSMGFAQGQLRVIMYITIFTALFNFLLNIVLIPVYGSEGAAIAFLVSTIFQTILYAKFTIQKHIPLSVKACFVAFTNALISVFIAKITSNNVIISATIAVIVACLLAIFTGQVNTRQLKSIFKP